jgi:putative redox protein
VIVEDRNIGPFAETVRVGTHVLSADEPVASGGTNTGPGPYDYVLAGLGACTAMTLRMYARQKNWPLQKVRVWLKHDKIHAQDCADCETKEGKIDQIDRQLVLEAMRSSAAAAADRRPLPGPRTLTSEIKIRRGSVGPLHSRFAGLG